MPEDFELNGKNIIILLIAFGFLFYGIFQGTQKAIIQKKERVEKFMSMPMYELAKYIQKKNSTTTNVDQITKRDPIIINGNILEINYYLKDGFLFKSISKIESLEESKKG